MGYSRQLVRVRRRSAVLGASAALLTALAGGCRLQPRDPPKTAAEPAPDFTLPDHEGNDVALADLLQQGPVVLIFYRGHW